MERKISQEVLEKIEREKISIKPRSYFICRSFFWLFFGGLVFFASIFALNFYIFYLETLKPLAVFANNPLAITPVLICLISVLIIGTAFIVALLYRKARICCRHENWMLLSVVIVGILGLGIFTYWMGIFKSNIFAIEEKELVNIKKYWSDPENGTLSGRVGIYYPEKNQFVLYTWTNNQWEVEIKKCPAKGQYFLTGNSIKMIGRKTGDYKFAAKKVWLWKE